MQTNSFHHFIFLSPALSPALHHHDHCFYHPTETQQFVRAHVKQTTDTKQTALARARRLNVPGRSPNILFPGRQTNRRFHIERERRGRKKIAEKKAESKQSFSRRVSNKQPKKSPPDPNTTQHNNTQQYRTSREVFQHQTHSVHVCTRGYGESVWDSFPT